MKAVMSKFYKVERFEDISLSLVISKASINNVSNSIPLVHIFS